MAIRIGVQIDNEDAIRKLNKGLEETKVKLTEAGKAGGKSGKEIAAALKNASAESKKAVGEINKSLSTMDKILSSVRKFSVGSETWIKAQGDLNKYTKQLEKAAVKHKQAAVSALEYANATGKAAAFSAKTGFKRVAALEAEKVATQKVSAALNTYISQAGKIAFLGKAGTAKFTASLLEQEVALKKLNMQVTASAINMGKFTREQKEALAVSKGVASAWKAPIKTVTTKTSKIKPDAKDIKGVSQAYTSMGSAMRGAAGASGKLWLAYGQLLPMLAGFAAASIAKDVVTLGASFEYLADKAIALEGLAGPISMTSEALQEALLEFKDLRIGPEGLAEGMVEFAQASVPMEEALKSVDTLAKVAAISNLSFAETVKASIGQGKAFGETYSDAANIIFAAANKSRASFTTMAKAMEHTTELGTLLGLSLEEVAAGLSVVIAGGISESKAATSLRTSFAALVAPTEKASKALQSIGFSAFDSQGKLKGFKQIFKDFSTGLKTLSTAEEKYKVLFSIFDRRSAKAPGALLNSIENIDEFLDATARATEGVGAIAQATQDLGDGAKVTFEQLKVDFEQALVKAFEGEKATDVLNNLRTLVQDESFITGIQNLAAAFLLVADALTAVANVPTFIKELSAEGKASAEFTKQLAEFGAQQIPEEVAAAFMVKPAIVIVGDSGQEITFEDALKAEGFLDPEAITISPEVQLKAAEAASIGEVKQDLVEISDATWKARDAYETYLGSLQKKNVAEGLTEVQKVMEGLDKQFELGREKLVTAMLPTDPKFKESLDELNAVVYEGAAAQEALAAARRKDIKAAEAQTKLTKEQKETLKAVNKGIEEYFKHEEKIAEATRDLNRAIEGVGFDAYKESLTGTAKIYAEISDKVETYREKLEDQGTLTEENAVLLGKYEQSLIAAAEANGSLARAGDDFMVGFGAGLKDVVKNMQSLGEIGFETAHDIRDALGSSLVSAIKGDWDSLEDVWSGVLDNLLKRGADWAVDTALSMGQDLATNLVSNSTGTLSSAGGAVGSLLSGDYAGAAKAAGGLFGKKQDVIDVYVVNLGESGAFGGAAEKIFDSAGDLFDSGAIAGGLATAFEAYSGWDSVATEIGSNFGDALDAIPAGEWTSSVSGVLDASYVDLADSFSEVATQASNSADIWSTTSDSVSLVGDTWAETADNFSQIDTSWVDKVGSKVTDFVGGAENFSTIAGGVGAAASAYGLYSGIKNISEGNVVSGGIQTGVSAYGAYQSAVTLAPEATAAIGKSVSTYLGSTGGAGPGAGAGVGSAAAVAAYAFIAYKIGTGILEATGRGSEGTALEGLESIGDPNFTGPGFDSTYTDAIHQQFTTMAEGISLDVEGITDQLSASFDKRGIQNLVGSISGISISATDAAQVLDLAALASEGNTDALYYMDAALQDLGLSEAQAATATLSILESMADLGQTSEEQVSAMQRAAEANEGYVETVDGVTGATESMGNSITTFSNSAQESVNAMAANAAQAAEELNATEFNLQATATIDVKTGNLSTDASATTESGAVRAFANGGMLQGGTGMADDLYMGKVNGAHVLAKGGEYFMPPEQTAKYFPMLEAMRTNKFANGGALGVTPGTSGAPNVDMGAFWDQVFEDMASGWQVASYQIGQELFGVFEMAGAGAEKIAVGVESINMEYQFLEAKARQYGVTQEKIDLIRQARAQEIANLYIEQDKQHMAAMSTIFETLDMDTTALQMKEVSYEFDELKKQLISSGGTAEELTLLEKARAQAMEDVREEQIKQLEQEAENIADFLDSFKDIIATENMSDYEKQVYALNDRYDDAIERAVELGVTTEDLALIEQARLIELGELSKATENLTESTAETFTNLADVLKEAETYGLQGAIVGGVQYHADGGIATTAHVFGEAGVEALIPLPYGPNMLSDIYDSTVNSDGGRPLNIQVFVGNKELESDIRIVADDVAYTRQDRNVQGRLYQPKVG